MFKQRLLGSLLAVALVMVASGLQCVTAPLAWSKNTQLVEQRKVYKRALKALANGRITEFRRHQRKLIDYPLYPYLQYEALRRKLYKAKAAEVDEFLKNYPHTPLARQLRVRWLKTLAAQQRWPEYKAYYQLDINSNALYCQYLWSRYQTGERQLALASVPEIWTVGRSQPKVCDKLFSAWRKAGHLNQDLAWQRIALSIENRKPGLARYLKRYLAKADQAKAELFLKVDRRPQDMEKLSALKKDNVKVRQILLHGIKKRARKDAQHAVELWHHYQALHTFTPEQVQATNRQLAMRLARQGHTEALVWLTLADPTLGDEELVQWRLRAALSQENWQAIDQSYERLPEAHRHKDNWRYWHARAEQQLGKSTELTHAGLEALAQERSFYGFLAADLLGQDYQFIHRPLQIDQFTTIRIASTPGIQRALELYILGEISKARREWRFAVRDYNPSELAAAAKIAQEWGWYSQGILTVIAGNVWDDLDIRFPVAYKEDIVFNAKSNALDSSWVFAVARQESAFMPDARSPVGATGLLQLMPRTARSTAKANGIYYRNKHELINPAKNIRLGSAYLRQMLNRFDGNRVYATAAYNAGPHRVDRWLEEIEAPYDIWIELIPFKETRRYVKNVLTYSVIYGNKIGEDVRLLNQQQLEELQSYYALLDNRQTSIENNELSESISAN